MLHLTRFKVIKKLTTKKLQIVRQMDQALDCLNFHTFVDRELLCLFRISYGFYDMSRSISLSFMSFLAGSA